MTPSQKKNDQVVCPNCGFENQPDATRCVRCDTLLNNITTIAGPAVAGIDALQPLAQPLALSVNEVLFLVAGMLDPVTITLAPDYRQIVIGRDVGGDDPPDLDLAGVSETAKSVSRRHALLDFEGERPTIIDLDSTNGTWVNENRLQVDRPHPFRTGDLLRLGQQFVFVYFSAGSESVEIISLSEHEPESVHLTPDLLVDHLGRYLQTLASIQDVLSQIQPPSPVPVSIKDMNVRQAPYLTKFRIAGASAAIRLVIDVLVPWRERHPNDLHPSVPSEGDEVSSELARLTQSHLAVLAPEVVEIERDAYVQQLLPHVRTLALHSLDLNIESKW
jgi:pSer/pThr/pTyr-binding forkhead associated (FHA) protein